MENDIWYIRLLGGYIPCSWKGFIFQFAIVGFVLGEFLLFGYIGDIIKIDLTIASIALALFTVIYNVIIINRHS